MHCVSACRVLSVCLWLRHNHTCYSGLAQSSPFWVNSRFSERVKAEVLALLRLMAAAPSLADYNGSIKSGDLTLPLIYSQ